MVTFLTHLSEDELETYHAFKKIAVREGKPFTSILKEMMKDYVKKHGEGNPNFSLEKFNDPGFRPFPTIGEILYPEVLAKWDKASLLETAQAVRSRGQEIRQELDRRGEPFRWNL